MNSVGKGEGVLQLLPLIMKRKLLVLSRKLPAVGTDLVLPLKNEDDQTLTTFPFQQGVLRKDMK